MAISKYIHKVINGHIKIHSHQRSMAISKYIHTKDSGPLIILPPPPPPGARLECGISWVRAPVGQIRDYKIGICCISAKHGALRRKNKDWLDRHQDHVSEWSDISTHRLCFSELTL